MREMPAEAAVRPLKNTKHSLSLWEWRFDRLGDLLAEPEEE
jgi:hypothetical protein